MQRTGLWQRDCDQRRRPQTAVGQRDFFRHSPLALKNLNRLQESVPHLIVHGIRQVLPG